ncbi:hypothetical protein HBI25_124260 [Parastagonospora nodorum]|nr:hypothetical protein HBI25_124260 [Parastagonospora nodorum]
MLSNLRISPDIRKRAVRKEVGGYVVCSTRAKFSPCVFVGGGTIHLLHIADFVSGFGSGYTLWLLRKQKCQTEKESATKEIEGIERENRYVWKGMVLKKQKSAEQAKTEGLFRGERPLKTIAMNPPKKENQFIRILLCLAHFASICSVFMCKMGFPVTLRV